MIHTIDNIKYCANSTYTNSCIALSHPEICDIDTTIAITIKRVGITILLILAVITSISLLLLNQKTNHGIVTHEMKVKVSDTSANVSNLSVHPMLSTLVTLSKDTVDLEGLSKGNLMVIMIGMLSCDDCLRHLGELCQSLAQHKDIQFVVAVESHTSSSERREYLRRIQGTISTLSNVYFFADSKEQQRKIKQDLSGSPSPMLLLQSSKKMSLIGYRQLFDAEGKVTTKANEQIINFFQ